MPGPLGCAQEYRAAFHWRGGAQVYGPPLGNSLVSVQWGRTADEVSDATIRLAPQALTPECFEAVIGRVLPTGELTGGLEPWIHELTLYRDSSLVWQGPVVRVLASPKTGITVEALDVAGWLDRVVNTWRLSFKDRAEPDEYRVKGPVTTIAHTVLKLNLGLSSLSPKTGRAGKSFTARLRKLFRMRGPSAREAVPVKAEPRDDWAGILNYVVEQKTKTVIRFEKDGSDNKAIWTEYVGNILRELVKRGLLYTTVGRSIVLRGRPGIDDPAVGRLTLGDFLGDVEMIRDGTSAATASWATSQDQQDVTKGRTEIVAKWGTEYGRLDVLTKISDANAEELRQAAANGLEGRYPAPIVINVPDGAQLSPEAPVGIDDLVCGERLDVISPEWRIGQGFMLSDVAVSWTGSGGEKVGVSLVPLADPYGKPTPPPDDLPVRAGVG